jgi:hypothetical protein
VEDEMRNEIASFVKLTAEETERSFPLWSAKNCKHQRR